MGDHGQHGQGARATDVAIVGAGAAGLSLAWRLCGLPPAVRPHVTLLDAPAGPTRPPERTWCYWEEPGGEFDSALTTSWGRLRVRAHDGGAVPVRPAPLRYKMLRSPAFAAFVRPRLERHPGLRRLVVHVGEVADVPGGALVRGVAEDGREVAVRARWVFDSRPPPRPPRARTRLVQHFRGLLVRTPAPVFDPGVADLMDFRTPQPAGGLSFGYLLPCSRTEALVEYTEFSPAVLDDAGYETALTGYARDVLGLRGYEVTGVEEGVIPMTDGHFARRAGAAVFRIGTAGGATRPSTGYTFAAIQRQTRHIAAALARGRTPLPPRAYPRRALAMDAVLLRALHSGRLDGPAFFTGLFGAVPARRLLRFLDGASTPAEEVALGLHTPVRPMLHTVAELPLLRRTPS
ncbi:lycopene cyclase [Streptomyces diacarni]|uniref:Lycopene cyclase n=1 Tax=Streptomyces diacarni TaxID=2800381 RepID=A0A367FB13_9ACTN|nr:lycopene cyclase family protein [Streptomyces diacarni]RCG27556.1 lycopene cyclase [Streptomyces diacarni]